MNHVLSARQMAVESHRTRAGVGLFFLLAFLFLSYSRVTDILLPNLYLPLIASLGALAAAVFTGGIPSALFSRPGMWLSAFTFWLVAATPSSYWRGGSVELLWTVWLKSFLVFTIIGGLLRTIGQCRMAMYAIAMATAFVAVMCLTIGTMSSEGRLVLERGVLSNPNDLAQLLLMGVPFLLLVIMSPSSTMITRFSAAAFGVMSILVALATGSRSALMAIACLSLVTFASVTWGNKVKLIVGFMILVPLLLLFVSSEQRLRYLTLFQPVTEAGQESARESMQQRMELLRQSLGMTMAHPMFGVGPGVYQAAAARESEFEGQRAMWRESHNTYSQVSSEAGIPALIFYMATMIVSFKLSYSSYRMARKRGDRDAANTCYCLCLSLTSFAVTAFFSSVAYQMYFPTLAGLSLAVHRTAVSVMKPVRATASNPPATAWPLLSARRPAAPYRF